MTAYLRMAEIHSAQVIRLFQTRLKCQYVEYIGYNNYSHK